MSVALVTDMQKDQIRLKNFEDSKYDPQKQKYGLFSFTGTLAILPNPYYSTTRPRRNSDGNVITGPPNISTSPPHKGKNPDALFSFPGFVSIGDKYKDPTRPQIYEKIRAEKMIKTHEVAFKPTGPTDMVSIQEYMSPDKPKIRKKRDSEGNLIFEPKNFYTSPMKKGHPNTTPGTSFGGNFEYISEPYSRKKDLEKKQRVESKAKMHEKPFKSTSNNTKVFNSDQEVYHTDDNLKKILKKSKPLKIANHEAPFKVPSPTKSYLIDSLFGKIPEYISDPFPSIKRGSRSPSPIWKHTTIEHTRPTPSISSMKMNIRSEFRSPSLNIR
jgi:Domain of unknown function (DUF4586)